MGRTDSIDITLEPREVGCPVPLTAVQFMAWNGFVGEGGLSDAKLSLASVRVLGPLNISLLKKSLKFVAQRHESLRTTIVTVHGTPTQHIAADYECDFELIDLSIVSLTDREREAHRLAVEFKKKKVNLSIGPLFDAQLIRLSDLEHILVLMVDHIISDGMSCAILSREIWFSYNEAAEGSPFSLPRPRLQFADYAVWQQRLHDACMRKQENDWNARITGASTIELPFDRGLSDVKIPTVTQMAFPLGNELSAKLSNMARREGTLLPLMVLAVYVTVMSRWCDQRDLVLAFASHGRHLHPELQNMIGFLANIIHLRIEIANDDCFLDVLKRVKREYCASHQTQNFGCASNFTAACRLQLGFNWLPTGRGSHAQTHGQLGIQPFPIRVPTVVDASSFGLWITGSSDPVTGTVMNALYRCDLFAPSTIIQFGQNFRLFTEEFVQHPLSRISSMSFQKLAEDAK